jgi:ankyrin repeat protein
MPLLKLPNEILMLVGEKLIGNSTNLYGISDLKSFLKVNRRLHCCITRVLWTFLSSTLPVNGYLAQLLLTDAINANKIRLLRRFLNAGAHIETPLSIDIPGEFLRPTPLMAAAYFDRLRMANFLLRRGAKIEYRRSYSALHAAQSAAMVRLLLENHANKEARDYEARRPLHCYAFRGNTEAMRTILAAGANPDPVASLSVSRLYFPWTPLYDAVLLGHVEAARILLDSGADLMRGDRLHNTLFHVAARTRHVEIMELLVQYCPSGLWAENYATLFSSGYLEIPLHVAARDGRTEMVDFLIHIWPNGIMERNADGDTPLHVAAEAGQTDVVELLVQHWPEGAEAQNRLLDTPLHLAAAGGRIDVVWTLVRWWPDAVKAKNDRFDTPLHRAASGRLWRMYDQPGMLKVAKFLLECWPEALGEKNCRAETPLRIAARAWKSDLLRLFLCCWPEILPGTLPH